MNPSAATGLSGKGERNAARQGRVEIRASVAHHNHIDAIPDLTIKGLPDELHARLKERAERHRRSMNSEAITILEGALTNRRPSAEEMIRRAEALKERIGKTFDADLIEEGKREGRA